MFEEGKKRAEEEKARAKQVEEQAKMAGMSEQERANYMKKKAEAQGPDKLSPESSKPTAPQSSPSNPQSTMTAKAESPKKDMENTADKKAAEEKAQAARTQAAQTDPRRTDNKPQPVQETAESLLASLNTKMDALIGLSAKQTNINENQLSSLKGLNNDMFNVA